MMHGPEVHAQDSLKQDNMLRELELHSPIILAGYSGAGKDTVSNAVAHVAKSMESGHNFYHSHSRFTDRPRRPSETQGVDGYFVTSDEFNLRKDNGEFFFDYRKDAYGGTRYGFSLPVLIGEIENGHTFIVGGEIDTSLGLKNALDDIAADSRKGLQHVLHPLVLFINRPVEEIVRGIEMRGAPEAEKRKRIEHVKNTWERYPKALEEAKGHVELVWNVDLDTAAKQVIGFVESAVAQQMADIYGSAAGKRK